MQINSLKLENFRNFDNKKFIFEKTNVIVGPNASGKTAIAEAIYLLSTAKPIRGDYDKDTINFDKEYCKIEGKINSKDETTKLEVIISKNKEEGNRSLKKLTVNGIPKLQKVFVGRLRSVLFTPENLNIFSQGPGERRKEIDNVLTQTDQNYRGYISDITKIIKNRNKVLEKINKEHKGLDELQYWDDNLIKTGGLLQESRQNYIHNIKDFFRQTGKTLDREVSEYLIEYKKSEVTKANLEKIRDREIATKMTLIGPTRDDFKVYLGGREIESFGSRGQQRTGILALKICELGFLETENKERPVLILDDILSELDEKHRGHVMNILHTQQTILTTTETSLAQKIPTSHYIEL
ncbi:MAG: DNA replication and repair protein RecF [Patescibacteria group bacterium]